MSKKMWLIIIFIILVIVITFCMRFYKKNEKLSFEKIVGVKLSDIMRAEDSYGKESSNVIKHFNDCSFIRYDGEFGNTAHRRLILYDKSNNEIATIIDIGNSGIIEIETRNSKQIYKMIDE